MRIAATGFVSAEAGSVASANAILLRFLVEKGHEIDFFSKPSFVDPRQAVGTLPRFQFVPVVNSWQDSVRKSCERIPILKFLTERLDASSYNKLLVRRIREKGRQQKYDVVLWLGDYAHSTVPGAMTVSFAQGPPGTDARAIVSRRREIRKLAGFAKTLKWTVLARLRLSRWGLPPLKCSDHIIVGSSVSSEILKTTYKHLTSCGVSTLPYPIDLELFKPNPPKVREATGALRVLWLGRIVPRKRLDLFLDGMALAIRNGMDVQITIVGGIGFVPGYERKIAEFPYPERLTWIRGMPREKIPALLQGNDVLIQPSDEENFGSSVAEAQACGLPVIIGHTNGNRDFLCERDIHLPDDHPESLLKALQVMEERGRTESGDAFKISREFAESKFNVATVAATLEALLKLIAEEKR